jgi:aldose 1-epimerase
MLGLVSCVFALPLAASAQSDRDEVVVLRNRGGMVVRLLPFGATVMAIEVPDRAGRYANVVLGYRSPKVYRARNYKNSFGATIGRYAGRIGNARFRLGSKWVRLQPNDGPNALHGGGPIKFDTLDWTVRRRVPAGREVTFELISPDGFQGFPGSLRVEVRYRLGDDNALRIDYTARTSRTTVLNLTNHSYFNLAGEGSGTIEHQRLRIAARDYVATDARGIPTGAFVPVAGTALDFRGTHAIGERIHSHVPPMTGRGYNHAWLFDKPLGTLAAVVRMEDPVSGRFLTVETTEPAIQVYSADYVDGKDQGASGRFLMPRGGVALETQHLPDSPNHATFPTTVLRPGQLFRSTTIWRFGISDRRSGRVADQSVAQGH